MSADVNFVCLSGRLTKDVDFKPIGQSTLITGSIAVNRSEKKDGGWKDVASFFNFKTWSKTEKQIEFYKNTFVKGAKILVNGSLVMESWEKDGQKQSRIIIDVSKIEPIGPSKGGASSEAGFCSDFPE